MFGTVIKLAEPALAAAVPLFADESRDDVAQPAMPASKESATDAFSQCRAAFLIIH